MGSIPYILAILAAICFFLDAFAGRSTTDKIVTPNFLARIQLTPLGLFLAVIAGLMGGGGVL